MVESKIEYRGLRKGTKLRSLIDSWNEVSMEHENSLKPTEVPWSYTEATHVGLLGAAAQRNGWRWLLESSVLKRPFEDLRRRPNWARLDLWTMNDRGVEQAWECKSFQWNLWGRNQADKVRGLLDYAARQLGQMPVDQKWDTSFAGVFIDGVLSDERLARASTTEDNIADAAGDFAEKMLDLNNWDASWSAVRHRDLDATRYDPKWSHSPVSALIVRSI